MHAIVRRSFVNTAIPSSSLYYEEAVDALTSAPRHHFTYHQSLWLGLVHLSRPDVDVRCKALRVLQTSHLVNCSPPTIARIQSMIRSTAPNVYFQAQQQVSSLLAAANPEAACGVLAECTLRLPQNRDGQERHALLSLEAWIPSIPVLSERVRCRLMDMEHCTIFFRSPFVTGNPTPTLCSFYGVHWWPITEHRIASQ
jgi:AraC-like DNA-binding protein